MFKGIDKRSQHPLHHSVISALDSVAKFQVNTSNNRTDPLVKLAEAKNLDAQELMTQEMDSKNDYLCTNYNVYLTHEPCTMCAMALLHARIGKCFYLFTTKFGYLNTQFKLHCKPELNHTYEAFEATDLDLSESCAQYFCKNDLASNKESE